MIVEFQLKWAHSKLDLQFTGRLVDSSKYTVHSPQIQSISITDISSLFKLCGMFEQDIPYKSNFIKLLAV